MKRRLRSTVTVGGLSILVLLVAAWVSSRWFDVGWMGRTGNAAGGHVTRIEFISGTLRFMHREYPRTTSTGGFLTVEQQWQDWTPRFFANRIYIPIGLRLPLQYRWAGGEVYLQLPLWIPVLCVGIPAVARAARAWHRRRCGLCGGCGYDLQGLAAGTPCPECGESRGQTTTNSVARADAA